MKTHNFTPWTNWDNRVLQSGINSPGVYVIANSNNVIDNIDFSWIEDIIYVGRTFGPLSKRLNNFDKSATTGKAAHSGGRSFYTAYGSRLNIEGSLYVSIHPLFIKRDISLADKLLLRGKIANMEYECFAEYVRKYSVLPKLNKI